MMRLQQQLQELRDAQAEDESDEIMALKLLLLALEFPNVRAVLKRTGVFVFGTSALYFRFPRQQDDAPIHLISSEGSRQDLLADHDKLSYRKFHRGIMEELSGCEDSIAEEQKMISQSMTEYFFWFSKRRCR
eukprot:Skav200090  [mRNA]  locus=scaffold694:216465:218665:- [translate_table: standard]